MFEKTKKVVKDFSTYFSGFFITALKSSLIYCAAGAAVMTIITAVSNVKEEE